MGKEALVKATVASSLGFDSNIEQQRQVDRVMALGMASRGNQLGSAIVHAEGLDELARREVVLLSARRLVRKNRVNMDFARNIAYAAMMEYMHPRCRSCGGIPFSDAKVSEVCPSCNGTGLHRYSDRERAEMAKTQNVPTRLYELALREIRDAVGFAVQGANRRLTSA